MVKISNFDKILEDVLKKEGLYSNHVNDTGGATKFGITESVARANGYKGSMKDLTLDFAKKIYRKDYWDSIKLEQINNYNLQHKMFDIGVNCGIGTSVKLTQRAFNILNTTNLLDTDGKIGSKTLTALNSYSKQDRLVKLLNAYQCKYYIDITEKNPKNKSFIYGWIDKRVEI